MRWSLSFVILMTTLGCQTPPSVPVTDHSVGGSAKTRYADPSPSKDQDNEIQAPPISNVDSTSQTTHALTRFYFSWQGVPHRYGGASREGVDCSGFVQLAYLDVFGTALPRTTRAQSRLGRRILKRNLSPGDLVFFKTGWRQRHVGVYIGDGAFIHASESKGVTRSMLRDYYWQQRYWKAKRLF